MSNTQSILLVEDNSIIQKFTKACFEREGCHVSVAGTKKAAIDWIETVTFSLILMDIGLPDGSGWEVIEYSREQTNNQNFSTPIVIISAHINEEKEREKCERWQVNKCFEKPLRFETIPEILSIMIS